MTSVNLFRPSVVDSLIPIRSAGGQDRSPLTISNFKKPYAGVISFLGWGEQISGPSAAPFFSEHRQVLKLQSKVFSIPDWFQNIFSLSKDVAEISSSKSASERSRAYQKIALTSIDFTTASIDLVQCLDAIHLIDL